MKKEIKIEPIIYPQPVLMLATYNEDGSVDVMNAAWGCAVDYDLLGISLTPTHRTCINFNRTKAFTVSLPTSQYVAEADYFGIVSGNDEPHKFEKTGLHASKAELVDAPVIEEFPLCLECKLDHIDEETGVVYGKIVRVSADPSCLDEQGHFDLSKADGILYDQSKREYYKVGEKLGKAFSLGLKFR